MRVHLLQNRMTFEQADTLLYYLSSQKLVTGVKVREKTQDATINFVGDREEVIRALKVFHYETAKVPETYLKNSGRELQNEYWEKLVNKVVMRMGSKMFLPVSVRSVITAVKSVKYLWHGVRTIAKGKLEVPVLDATAISVDQLALLATGDPGRAQGNALGSAGISVPGAAAETSPCASEEPWNVTTIALVDGPAGLRLKREYQVDNGEIVASDFLAALEGGFFSKPQEKRGTTYYQFCTAIPVGTLLAQSWDVELIKRVGEMIGHEMELFNVTLWLAPGMNIHRNPLCGRNFEYYSEDPLLAGMMAAAMTLGVQKVPGCGTTIKHFACNNQEDNRMGSDSILSERALREIYLKGFEIAVKDAQPMSIMTSYNLINGVHAANCYDTCTKAARDEWGFAGAIMTDWTTTNVQIQGECTAAGCMRAGNDMVMPGLPEDHENIKKELADGTLTMAELKRCIYNTVNIVLQSNMYEGAVSYLDQFDDLDTYLVVK